MASKKKENKPKNEETEELKKDHEEKVENLKEEKSQEDNKQEQNSEDNNKIKKDEDKIKEKKIKLNEKGDKQKTTTQKITKEEFTENILKKKKEQMKIAFIITIIVIVLLFLSIIFAVININRTTYINGISMKGINLSGLTMEEAKIKLQELIEIELNNQINIVYNSETITAIKPEDIEFNYDLANQLIEVYKIGRNRNIFKNNYEIVITAILKKDIDLNYTYNEEKLEKIIKDLEPSIPGIVKNPSYYIEGEELIIVPGTDGIAIEKEKLKNSMIEKITQSNSNQIVNGEYDSTVEITVAEKKAEDINIEKIYEEIYCEPKDAHYIEEPFELFMDEDGIDFGITMDEAKNIISVEAEEYKIPLKITKANITISDIDSSAFRYEISTFTTNYDPGYTSRVNNLQLAAGKINGKVLGPGEEFSFNEVVGKRTIEAGYTDAKIFVNGEVVDGTGGGICQISTTLYNAVLLANLQITDRRNHNYTTSYVKPGRDATVVYGSIDFKFQNNRKYPIKIEASVNGGVVRFTIYGVQEENEYEIKIIPVVTQTIPKTTKYIDDATLVEGSEVVQQVGSSGCKVTTYKETYLNGSLISKDVISNDVYKVMQRIVKRGTKKASVPVVSQPVEETPPVIEQPTTEVENTPEIETPVEDTPVEETPLVPEVKNTTM